MNWLLRVIAATALTAAAGVVRAEIVAIDNAELAKLSARGAAVIDIRTAPEWQETGIVPRSRLLTYFDEQGKVDTGAWLAKLKAIAKPGEPVVLICRSGRRSLAASEFLSRQTGYARVYNLKNGINGWIKEGRVRASAAATIAACRSTRTC